MVGRQSGSYDGAVAKFRVRRRSGISALNKIRQVHVHPEIELDTQLVETVLAAEIIGHYRSYQILEALRIPENFDEPVMRALGESIQQVFISARQRRSILA